MLRVGLTGGLASGKSTVARLFRERGLHVLLADLLAHELMLPGKPVYNEVVRVFGTDILPGGAGSPIDRVKLAAKVFAPGPESGKGAGPRLAELNAIVHPAVLREQEVWLTQIARQDPRGIAVVEAALLYEAHADSQFDKMVVVTAADDLKISRYAERVALQRTAEQARFDAVRRMAAQIPDEVKRRWADFVIENSGTTAELEVQAERVVAELRAAQNLQN